MRAGRGVTADPARQAALDLVLAALGRRAGLEAALDGAVLAQLSPQDRAFARALAMTTLRRLGQIDQVLEARLTRAPPDRVRMILRLGAAQIFFLQVPDY